MGISLADGIYSVSLFLLFYIYISMHGAINYIIEKLI